MGKHEEDCGNFLGDLCMGRVWCFKFEDPANGRQTKFGPQNTLGNSYNHIEKGKHFRLLSIPSKRMISELLSIYSKCFYGFAAQDQQNVHRYWRKQLPCHWVYTSGCPTILGHAPEMFLLGCSEPGKCVGCVNINVNARLEKRSWRLER